VTERERVIRLNGIGGVTLKTRTEIVALASWRSLYRLEADATVQSGFFHWQPAVILNV